MAPVSRSYTRGLGARQTKFLGTESATAQRLTSMRPGARWFGLGRSGARLMLPTVRTRTKSGVPHLFELSLSPSF